MGQLVQGATYLLVYFAAFGCSIDPALRRSRLEARPHSPPPIQLGQVTIDPATRSIRFPARLNLDRVPLEYFLVAEGGKLHESLFVTQVAPHDIHAAMLLLGAKGSGAAPGSPAEEVALAGDRISISVEWKRHWTRHQSPAQALVHDRAAGSPLTEETWSYNGSRTAEGAFVADLEGSIVSLITDPDALVNSRSPRRVDDENWVAEQPGILPVGTPVTVVFRLWPLEPGLNSASSYR